MPMAMRDSVTVSIAALTRGTFSEISRVRRDDVSISAGVRSEYPGTNRTSS